MDTLSIILPASRPKALSLLLNQVLAGDDAVLIVEGDERPALLDEAASQLAGHHYRVLRAAAAGPGGLSLSGLMAQVAGRPDLTVHDDAVLELGFRMLTVPDETCAEIVLLVSGAQELHRKALRYLQFACGASASLRLVLAGEPGLIGVLSWEEADFLHARLGSRPVIAIEAPEPWVALPGSAVRDALSDRVPAGLPRQGGMPHVGPVAPAASRTRWLAGGAMLGLVVVSGVAALALGARGDRHGWPVSASGPVAVDGAATGAARAVAQSAPPQSAPPPAAPPSVAASAARQADAGGVLAGSPPLTSGAPAGVPSGPAYPIAGPAHPPDRTVGADSAALPSAAHDAAALPSSPKQTSPAPPLQATSAAPDQSASLSQTIPSPDAASSPAQERAAHEASPVQSPPITGAAGMIAVPDGSAPPSQAAASLPDDAAAVLSALPRPSRKAAPRQADAPAREAQHGGEVPQDAPRRETTTTPHSAARIVSLRPRAPEAHASEMRASATRDDLPLPPPFARRPQHVARRPISLAPGLPNPEPPEPEVGIQSYIGTFGMDSNGLRTFHPGQ